MMDTTSTPTLRTLPAELIFEIAVRSPIRAFCGVMHVDARLVATIRLQRALRRWDPHGVSSCLSVGDRVLVRTKSCAAALYATAVAEVVGQRELWHAEGALTDTRGERLWKVHLLMRDEYLIVSASRVRRLDGWADGSAPGSVGQKAALASAYRYASILSPRSSVMATMPRASEAAATSA